MPDNTLYFCATDKEIYDVLMSAERRVSDDDLLGMARARGIFYAPGASRESLARRIALLPHDYESLSELLGQSENPTRADKVTSVKLDAVLSVDEIKEVCGIIEKNSLVGDKVTTHAEGPDKVSMQVQYSEIDFTKTRLLQRRKREADVKLIIEGDKTTIRIPATPKGREIAALLKTGLDATKKTDIPTELIEIEDLLTDERTSFFTSLIAELEGFVLRNVNNVKVQSGENAGPPDEIDVEDAEDDETVEAGEEMLSVVENVALKGQALLSSSEYQHLRKKGFYITSITWVSQQIQAPNHQIEFYAGFEEPEQGKSFRYNVRGMYRHQEEQGKFTKTLRPIKGEYKQEILPVLERTAHKVLAQLRENRNESASAPAPASQMPSEGAQ